MFNLNPYPAAKMSRAKCLICYNLHNALKSFKVDENIVRVSNILDPGEMPGYSASHPDPSCLHIAPRSRSAG